MGDNTVVYIGGHIITNKLIETTRLDSKKLAQAISADILENCKTKSSYYKFTVK